MSFTRIAPAALSAALVFAALSPALASAPPVKTADPWESATRDPALARIYETVGDKLLVPPADTPEAVASEKHVAARLVNLSRADPSNAFPYYLLALALGRYGKWKAAAEVLHEGNALPGVVYPISGDVLTRRFPALLALRDLSRFAERATTDGSLSDAEATVLLTEVRTMGNRLARQGEPRDPILVSVGGVIRLTAENGIAAAQDRAGHTAEAAAARSMAAKLHDWNEDAVRRYQTELGPGGPQGPEVVGKPLGITLADIRNHMNGAALTPAARRKWPAFNRGLALKERHVADRALQEMPD